MKKLLNTICVSMLCFVLSFCACSCVPYGSASNSLSSNTYSYKEPIKPPDFSNFDTINFDDFDLGNWETEAVYIITYDTHLVRNNHVGDSWGCGLEYSGEYIESEHQIKCSAVMRKIPVKAVAIEYDSYNDYGAVWVDLELPDVGKSTVEEVSVTVRENRGRYSGNTAQWIFKITIERIS